MGILDKVKRDGEATGEISAVEAQAAPHIICAPVSGSVVARTDVDSKMFSEGYFGRGCGIEPVEEVVYAPVNGTVTMEMAGSRHAIGLAAEGGEQVVIHVGIGTVSMEGKGFTYLVSQGDKVFAGQPLLTFSRDEISKAGYPDTVTIGIVNADEFANVRLLDEDRVWAGEQLLEVTEA